MEIVDPFEWIPATRVALAQGSSQKTRCVRPTFLLSTLLSIPNNDQGTRYIFNKLYIKMPQTYINSLIVYGIMQSPVITQRVFQNE